MKSFFTLIRSLLSEVKLIWLRTRLSASNNNGSRNRSENNKKRVEEVSSTLPRRTRLVNTHIHKDTRKSKHKRKISCPKGSSEIPIISLAWRERSSALTLITINTQTDGRTDKQYTTIYPQNKCTHKMFYVVQPKKKKTIVTQDWKIKYWPKTKT